MRTATPIPSLPTPHPSTPPPTSHPGRRHAELNNVVWSTVLPGLLREQLLIGGLAPFFYAVWDLGGKFVLPRDGVRLTGQ